MIQTLSCEDEQYVVKVTLDHPTVINFYSGLVTSVITEVSPLHAQSPVAQVFFRPGGPALYRMTVDLVDGRNATFDFYVEDLLKYTFTIDGSAPWTENEALKLPVIRRSITSVHNVYGVSSFKLTYKVVP